MSNTDQLLDDIPEYGSAFVCGKSRFEEGKFHVRDDPILQLSCGDEHTGVVTEKGRVFMFGSNNWGQLGLGHENNIDRPSCIKSLKLEKAKLIACGRNHTLVATEEGNIYAFGCNSESQLGLGDNANDSFYSSPQRIKSLEPQDWLMLSAGAGHSCALSRNGVLYVWGINDNGEIGLGKINEQSSPKVIDLGVKISFVSCGYYHTALITRKGGVYTAGNNDYFQLGRDSREDMRRFNKVEEIDEPAKYVSCGGGHTVLVTTSGRVYSFGDGSKGQLGNGADLQKSMPELVMSLKKIKIEKVSCGECHTAFISDHGELFTCGDNRYGKLGLNQKTYNSIQFTPVLVQKFRQLSIEAISCGGCHMILIGRLRDNLNNNDSSIDERYSKDYRDERLNSSRKSSSPRKYDNSLSKRYSNNKDSDSEFDNEEAERTFNRTHTLTRDNKFIPLSDLNLKKLVKNDEEMTRHSKHNDRDAYSNFRANNQTSYKKTSNDNRYYKNESDSDSDSFDNSKKDYRKSNNNKMNLQDYKRTNSKQFKSFSDDEDSKESRNKSAYRSNFGKENNNESSYKTNSGGPFNRNRAVSNYNSDTPRSSRMNMESNSKFSDKETDKAKEKKFKLCTIL